MKYPRLNIDIKKLRNNIKIIKSILDSRNVELMAVTKVFMSRPEIVDIYLQEGINLIADSRIDNLKKIYDFNCTKIILRIPSFSEISDIVKFSDISLNSDFNTIKLLNKEAMKLNKKHKIILMMDFGDLREGYFYDDDLFKDIENIFKLDYIKIYGIGVNLKCYGGVIPTPEMMNKLSLYKKIIENKYDLKMDIVSGGNSSSFYLVENDEIYDINNLRIGEAIVLGRELAYDKRIKDTFDDVFTLEAEIIELKEKASIPIGEIGFDAFGDKPKFIDRGIRKRAILNIGKLDISTESLFPIDKDIIILGASSDHTIIDISDSKIGYKLGDIIRFKLDYSGILMASSSDFVYKKIINEV